MTNPRLAPKIAIFIVLLTVTACSRTPTGPTEAGPTAPGGLAAGDPSGPFSSVVRSTASSAAVDLATCLGGSAAAACFSANRVGTMGVVSGALTSAPVFNNNNPTLTTGPTVTLSWTPPAVGVATSYTIEASTTPGGPANLANSSTGNNQTSLVVQGVPPGIYFVRVRAVDSSGPSPPSNEVQVIVTSGGSGGGGCPSAPQSLNVVFQNGTVTMTWLAPATGVASSYVIQAGSAAGLANLANSDTGSAALSFVATGIPAGTYYIRVYGRNIACSSQGSIGPSSNEVTIGGTTGGATGGWGGQISCRKNVSGPFNYHHDETQTWDVRATVPQSAGRTVYPFDWRSTGSGGRSFGSTDATWNVTGAAGAGELAVFPNSAGINFSRINGPTVIHGGLAGTPTSYDDYEFLFLPFTAPIGSTRAIGSRTYTGQPCDTPVTPAGSVCTVVCTWDMSLR